jgi:tRNA (guanine37-N1)-methyltransferase
MRITICTLFPEMFENFLQTSIIKKAQLQDYVVIDTVNIRDFTDDKHNRVDDYPFGGGAGLVMKVQPIADMLQQVVTPTSKVVYLTPVAPVMNQIKAKQLSQIEHLVLLCGHYEGVDERVLDYVDEVLSIGDYILTGGEVAAMVVTDAVVRLIKGVISENSIEVESFEDSLLEYPQYTRPADYKGLKVPDILLSGHHQNIASWQQKEAIRKTYLHRKDLLKKATLNKQQLKMLEEVIDEESKNH